MGARIHIEGQTMWVPEGFSEDVKLPPDRTTVHTLYGMKEGFRLGTRDFLPGDENLQIIGGTASAIADSYIPPEVLARMARIRLNQQLRDELIS